MSVWFVVSFFNQINHYLSENKVCALMVPPAFEVTEGAESFDVGSGKELDGRTLEALVCAWRSVSITVCVCVRVCVCMCCEECFYNCVCVCMCVHGVVCI